MKKLLLSLTLVCFVGLALGGTARAEPPTRTSLAAAFTGADTAPLRPVWATTADPVAPTVTAIDPGTAPNDIDTPVTITGAGFAAQMDGAGTVVLTAPTVSLGGTALADVTWVDSTTLTATVPWALDPGSFTLTVVNPDGGAGSLTGAFTVTQGIGQWNSGDLFGGQVTQLLMKPGDPGTLYALAGEVGLFRSRDAGEHWSFIRGDVVGGADFVVDPLHPSWLYTYAYAGAGHSGLWRSKDEGDTWACVVPSSSEQQYANYREAFPSPHDPQVLFLRTAALYARSGPKRSTSDTPPFGLVKSTDGGASWRVVADMDGVSVHAVAFHPTDPLKMVLATQTGEVYRSVDGGDHWSEVLKPPLGSVSSITYNPYRPAEVWLTSRYLPWDAAGGTIFKSADASFTSWLNVTQKEPPYGGWFLTFTSADSVYTNARHSDDGGETWDMFGPMTGSGEIRFDPGDPRIGYIGDDTYGVQKTTDGGKSWEIKSQGLSGMRCDSMEVSRADPLRVYAPLRGGPGIYRSTDGASTWAFIPIDGVYNPRQVREDPSDPQRLYVAADTGFYLSENGGGSWSALGWKTPPSSPFGLPMAMQPDPNQPGHLLVGINTGLTGRVYASGDSGVSWQAVTMPQELSWITSIVFDPETPGSVYLTTSTFSTTGGTGVYRSTDSGRTWDRIDDRRQRNMQDAAGITIATHPRRILYVAAQQEPFRSVDGGVTWERTPAPDGYGADLLFVDGDSTRLYSADIHGLQFSGNAGDSWRRAAGVIGRLNVTALDYAVAGDRTILYAATCGGDPGVAGGAAARTSRTARDTASRLVDAGIYRYVQLPAPRLALKLSGLKRGALRIGGRLAAKGTVTPIRFAGSQVKLTVQKQGRKWATVKTVMLASSATGAYHWTYRPARRGVYRLQATIAKTNRSAAAATAWRPFRVK